MRRYSRNPWESAAFGFGAAVLCGAACMAALSGIFALMSLYMFNTMDFSDFFSVLTLAAGGYFSGYICGKYRRKRGFIDGLICGALLFLIIFILGLLLGESTEKQKLLLLLIAGAVGGVGGVNSKRPKKLM